MVPPFITKGIQDQVLGKKRFQEVPFIAPVKCCRLLNFFQFVIEGVIKVYHKLCLHSPDEILQMFCRLLAVSSLIALKKVFSLVLLFCCIYVFFDNMHIETKLAIQNKTQLFLAGRS